MTVADKNRPVSYTGEISDEELIKLFRNGDQEAFRCLSERYSGIIKSRASTYYLAGASFDDIYQECMIGLYRAVMDFEVDGDIPFCAFAAICINRRVITAVKSYSRLKHSPLNNSLSINMFTENNTKCNLPYCMYGNEMSDPEDEVLSQHEFSELLVQMKTHLSVMEYRVLTMFINHESYISMAKHLGVPVKHIDNALQRARRKIKKWL